MHTCMAFLMTDKERQFHHLRKLVRVENIGEKCSKKDLYDGKKTKRVLLKCHKCDALVLFERAKYYPLYSDNSYFLRYVPVESKEEAVKIDLQYKGTKIESENMIQFISVNY